VVVTFDSGSSQYVPVVRYGQADGTFSAPNSLGSFNLAFSPAMVFAGDFNGDGHTDLILAGSANSQQSYQVLLNDGTGHFQQRRRWGSSVQFCFSCACGGRRFQS
jgi:hypothetical protein